MARYSYFLVPLAAALMLAACNGRPGPESLRPQAPSATSENVTVFVATTRGRSADDANVFTKERSRALNFQRYEISIPPNHENGRLELPQ